MATRYRRKSLQDLINTGDRFMAGLIVMVVLFAIYGLLDRLGQG